MEIEFDSLRSRYYALEQTEKLSTTSVWNNVSGDVQGIDALMNLSHTNSADQGMYRIKAKLPSDL